MTIDSDPQATANAFNSIHPVETPVRYWTGVREGAGRTGRTRTPAQVLSGHTAVVWLHGVSGCINLTHVEVISEDELIPEPPKPTASPDVLDLDAAEARANAATDGPWWAWNRGVGYVIAVGQPGDINQDERPARELPEGLRTDIGREADAEFIAHARTDVPKMAAEIRQLRAENQQLREQVFAQKPVVGAAHTWAEAHEESNHEATIRATADLYDAVEQHRLMDLALTSARDGVDTPGR
ncbi:hypothetical protein ABT336_13115 [Micromonospora sp. NPDC000207]|uniref:hypothetical protein n=1 Tax=Micromonospora sp. NPDC000207 TaxID=3154246 RepID=UPI00332700A7